jgi:hypothetical protein
VFDSSDGGVPEVVPDLVLDVTDVLEDLLLDLRLEVGRVEALADLLEGIAHPLPRVPDLGADRCRVGVGRVGVAGTPGGASHPADADRRFVVGFGHHPSPVRPVVPVEDP